jgi:hypothetical protein
MRRGLLQLNHDVSSVTIYIRNIPSGSGERVLNVGLGKSYGIKLPISTT